MSYRIIPAIMSGGASARLWPLSTDSRPKQFHRLSGAQSLFAETLARTSGVVGSLSFSRPMVLCNIAHERMVLDHSQIAGIEPEFIVLEPVARNTAAVIAVASALAVERDPEALLLVLPADHIISNVDAFHKAVATGAPVAQHRIVTFGISPDRPATGYGYISLGEKLADGVHAVKHFKEKPDEHTAASYISSGGNVWNSGMLLGSPRLFLEEFKLAPEIRSAALDAVSTAVVTGNRVQLDAEAFAKAPSVPFDTAVLEKTERCAVVPCDIGWADVGSWDETWRLATKDGFGNAIDGPVVALNSTNNLLRSSGQKIAVSGVHDLVVVATDEGILIVSREQAQDVKALKGLIDDL